MSDTAVGFAQFEPRFGEVDKNIAAIERLAKESASADLLVFPELATTGYEFIDRAEARDLAETFGEGPLSKTLRELAGDQQRTLVCGYAERAGDSQYNSCMLALPDGTLHNYRKLHLFSREKLLFDSGDAPPPVIDTPAGRVGLMICFDWFFPETARILALSGAQIIAHPSNLVLQYCQRAMFARSVENHVYTITANRTGTESRAGRSLTFTGASQILSPTGETLAQADETGESVNLVAIDPEAADDKAINEHNDLIGDRRSEWYGALTESAQSS